MNAPSFIGRKHYAGVVVTKAAIKLARQCDIDVGGFELRPDGTIAVYDSRTAVAIEAMKLADFGKE